MTASGFARVAAVVCAMVAALVTSDFAFAQNYPTRPVRMVTSGAGGASDFVSRLIAQGMTTGLGQQVIVDNRAGGVVSVEVVAKAPPDGYTTLYYGSTLWLLPLMQDVSYDMFRDFAPVSLAVNSPTVLAVNPSLPVKSLKELIAMAKAKPGTLNYGKASPGSSSNMSTELFKFMAGVDMVGVPYKGAGQALNALMAGEIQIFMASASGLTAHINSGKIRPLALAGSRRSASLPNLPTMAEAGLPGYEYSQMSGLFAPAKTPPAIIDRLSKEVVAAIHRPDIKERLASVGTEAEGSTPQEATAKINSEVARLGKVIKAANIRAE